MDIYHYLKKDHREVSELLDQISASRSPQKREELLAEVHELFLQHSEAEEATFYAALEKYPAMKETIEHAREEHKLAERFLEDLEEPPEDRTAWNKAFGELKESILHHIQEEEGNIFKQAKKHLSSEEAKQLATDMKEMKQKMMEDEEAEENEE